jgi:hypothetical protein
MEYSDAVEVLADLFRRTKQKDEFEFTSTLLRIMGIESAGWDTLEETVALFDDLSCLLWVKSMRRNS